MYLAVRASIDVRSRDRWMRLRLFAVPLPDLRTRPAPLSCGDGVAPDRADGVLSGRWSRCHPTEFHAMLRTVAQPGATRICHPHDRLFRWWRCSAINSDRRRLGTCDGARERLVPKEQQRTYRARAIGQVHSPASGLIVDGTATRRRYMKTYAEELIHAEFPPSRS